jgi:hypothetical protein
MKDLYDRMRIDNCHVLLENSRKEQGTIDVT